MSFNQKSHAILIKYYLNKLLNRSNYKITTKFYKNIH